MCAVLIASVACKARRRNSCGNFQKVFITVYYILITAGKLNIIFLIILNNLFTMKESGEIMRR